MSANVAVAPHLTDELKACGIEGHTIYSSLSFNIDDIKCEATSTKSNRVLVYLPQSRFEFYGGSVIARVIANSSELDFVIVGESGDNPFENARNVRHLGWVSDMQLVYDSVGCVVRVTSHDGLPRMILEALAREKYVIYSQKLPGCWQAATYEQVMDKLRLFASKPMPNKEGRAAIAALFTPSPARKWASLIIDLSQGKSSRRLRGMAEGLAYACRAVKTKLAQAAERKVARPM